MRGHLGAVLTSGLAAVALALAVLQAAVLLAHGGGPQAEALSSARTERSESNRFSAPGGRAGIPYLPFEKTSAPPEGRTPERQQEEQHPPPPPSRFRSTPPRTGPQPARRVAA